MAAELEDLRERVERVEELLGTVESRMGGVDAILEILCAGPMAIGTAFRPDSQAPGQALSPTATDGQDSNLKRLDSMMRSALLHHASHESDLRKAIRFLKVLVDRTKP